MATLTISIVSAGGTTTDTVTFSGPDTTRILNGFKKYSNNANATQQDLTDYLKTEALNAFKRWVNQNEVVVTTPVAPVFTSS